MGKLILISGSNNSGKSRYAEQMIAQTTGNRYYIATMIPQIEENYTRIEKHKDQRKDLQFQTLELPYQIGNAAVDAKGVVLLEDVSNLLANMIFEKGGNEQQVFADIQKLLSRCKLLVAVTIGGLVDEGYDQQTADYINGLNRLNELLAELSEVSIVMENKVPRFEKGDIHGIF